MKNDEIIYSIRTTNQFRKSLKRMSKRGYNLDLLDNVVDILSKGKKLPKKKDIKETVIITDAKGRKVEIGLPISTYAISTMDVIDYIIPLKGNYIGHCECHIAPDWLLIYKITEKDLILLLTDTGSHSDLFE